MLDRNDESFVFSEPFLIHIECQEMAGPDDAGGGDMEDIKAPVSAGEGVGG
jgi:hypothetical protein